MASDESDNSTAGSFEVEEFEVEEEDSFVVEDSPRQDVAQAIQPYSFEPLAAAAADPLAVLPEQRLREERIGDVTEWCACGHCSNLSPRENVCCREVTEVMDKCAEVGELECVTAHPGFEGVCQNEWVLQVAYNHFGQLHGEMPEASVEGRLRHSSYRNFVMWCWGFLGRRVRVVIPSCVVTRIRDKFPEASGRYAGFKLH